MSPLTASATLLILLSIQSVSSAQSGVLAQHGILTPSSNPFDGGRVGSCEIPIVTGVCSEYVDYPVPTSIARLASIVEDTIETSTRQLNDMCRQTWQEMQCRLRFPRCLQLQNGTESDYSQVDLNRQDCSVLRSACPIGLGEHLEDVCNGLTTATVPSAGCTPLSNYSYNFEYCDFSNADNILVTEWMFQLMRFEDLRPMGILFDNEYCGQGLAKFLCRSVGECTSSGEEIVYINTHESCNDAVGCYNDDLQVHVQDEVTCSLWPQAHLQYQPTTTTPDSSPKTQTETTSKEDNSIDLDVFLDQFSTGVTTKQYLTWTMATMLIGLVLS